MEVSEKKYSEQNSKIDFPPQPLAGLHCRQQQSIRDIDVSCGLFQ
jgi:hypothetical protein